MNWSSLLRKLGKWLLQKGSEELLKGGEELLKEAAKKVAKKS